MEKVAPLGPAYQAGTMAGNPASISAGIACLEVLQETGIYDRMDALARRLKDGLLDAARANGIALTVNQIVGSLSTHFCDHEVTNYDQALDTDGELFGRFFKGMLNEGINLAPSKYEAWFMTIAHTEADVDYTIAAAHKVMSTL